MNPGNDVGYRQAVDAVLSRFPNEQQFEIISAAREFHPFWIGDLKTIARLNAADALLLEQVNVDVQGTLIDMFERLDRDAWSRQAQDCLTQYLQQLASNGADRAILDIRERLLMLLLFAIRHVPATPSAYRSGVDAMLTLFIKEEPRRVFLDVAREFFYFWTGYHRGQQSTVAEAA